MLHGSPREVTMGVSEYQIVRTPLRYNSLLRRGGEPHQHHVAHQTSVSYTEASTPKRMHAQKGVAAPILIFIRVRYRLLGIAFRELGLLPVSMSIECRHNQRLRI